MKQGEIFNISEPEYMGEMIKLDPFQHKVEQGELSGVWEWRDGVLFRVGGRNHGKTASQIQEETE